MDTTEKKELTTRFWRFLWSSILIALSGCLGNVVGGIIVGNLVSSDGVSAINLTRPVIQFLFTISMLISSGGGMLLGFSLGQKNHDRVRRIFKQVTLGCVMIGLLFMCIGLFAPEQATRLLCHNDALLPLTTQYMRVVLIGAPAYLLFWHLSMMVNTDGSPRLVSLAVIVDNVVNLVLNYVFIKYFGWGIAGSSTATVMGHLVGIALMLRHFGYADCHLSLKGAYGASEWRNVISQGAPLAVASICLTLLLYSANTIIGQTAGRVGLFVFAVCMNLLQIYNLFLAGTCRTLQTLGAVQVGEKNEEGFRLVLTKAFWFITISMAVTCVYVWVAPQSIAELFGANEPEQISQCNHALRIFALSFIPFCYIYTVMIVYKLFAQHRMALFISFALSLTVIPVLWIVSRYWPNAMWYSYLIAYIIEMIAIVVLHKAMKIKFELNNPQ
ncbi:MAG: hypothetical protein IKH19_01970 [Muribaculaceae bacterium]|nr:hypothetical protein [Muribaculaceae bacterium]